MSEFKTVRGFEEIWRPPSRPLTRTTRAVLAPRGGPVTRDRLVRVANRVPEVMVKVTGRTGDGGHLHAHLEYISRNGSLELEDRDGAILTTMREVRELGDGWVAEAEADHRRRANSPVSLSVILSMPEETDPTIVRDAARAFANDMFGAERDYVFALHTDTPRPHVHLTVCARGDDGQRLNPKKADLEHWRQVFAQSLRDRGAEAEATPRRARGITRKAERMPLRQIADRHRAGRGEIARTERAAYQEAAKAAFAGGGKPALWEQRIVERQAHIRALYLAQAELLACTGEDRDRRLAREVAEFVRTMPPPDSRRLALARELRGASAGRDRADDPTHRERER